MPALQDSIPGGGSGVMSNPVAGGSAAAVAASGGAGRGGGERPIIINVQTPVQADSFIRSRAEISRAMRG
jgi:hypothetical protein